MMYVAMHSEISSPPCGASLDVLFFAAPAMAPSDLDPHPLGTPRQSRHLQRRTRGLHDENVGEVRTDAALRIEQPRFNREAHPGVEHGVIAERKVGSLVAFHALAVGGTVVDVLLNALLHLVFVDRERDLGALGAFERQIFM